MSGREVVFAVRGLVKRRVGAAATFELQVPRLAIRAGEVAVLRGVSGSGKSTLLDLLALALQPDSVDAFSFSPRGSAASDVDRLWAARDFNALGRLRAAHIGYVLQTGGLLPFLTVRENIALSCRLLGQQGAGRIGDLARRLDITAQLAKRPGQLSVGERQRVAIARALAHGPSVVLADEPTASVDPVNARAILGLFLELVTQMGVTAVIASHDWHSEAAAGFQILQQRIERDGQTTRSLFWN